MSNGFVQTLLAESRATARAANADRTASDAAFDALDRAAVDGNVFDLWNRMDDQAGRAMDRALQASLMDLRVRFVEALVDSECARLRDAGWDAFILLVADAVSYFRFKFVLRLCDCVPVPDVEMRNRLAEIRRAMDELSRFRFERAARAVSELTDTKGLPNRTRAWLLLILASSIDDANRAKALYDQTRELAPEEHRILAAYGDHCALTSRPDEAKTFYERAIAALPNGVLGYVGLGSLAEAERNYTEAERCYRQAIDADAGAVTPQRKLLKLYGRPELYATHEPELVPLMEQMIAGDPVAEYVAYCDLAEVYGQNDRVEEAVGLYEKAIAVDPERPDAYTALSTLLQEQGRLEEARSVYERGLASVADFYEAYRGLIALCVDKQKPEEAQSWRKKIEEAATNALSRADHDSSPVRALEALGADYTNAKDVEAARRIYDALSGALGLSYDGMYHNWLGNLYYYLDQDAKAAEEYELAVAATPTDAVFHRNLAGAYRTLKRYEDAAAAYQRALDLDNNHESFNKAMAGLRNAEGNAFFADGRYEEAAAKYTEAAELHGDDVIWSNLAGAWEQIAEAGDQNGYNMAVRALEQVQASKPSAELEQRILSVVSKAAVYRLYGRVVAQRIPIVTPLVVDVAPNLISLVSGSDRASLSEEMGQQMNAMRRRVEDEFGVRVPSVRFREGSPDLGKGYYIISLREVPLEFSIIPSDSHFFPGPSSELASLAVTGEEGVNPLTGSQGMWCAAPDWPKLLEAERSLWTTTEYIVRHLEAVVRRNLADLAGHFEIANMLRSVNPSAAEELEKSERKLTALTAVCRGLLAEGVPINPLDRVYNVFDALYTQRPLYKVVEAIRLSVQRDRISRVSRTYRPLALGPRLESALSYAIHHSGAHAVLAMEPDSCSAVLRAIREAVNGQKSVLIVGEATLRPFVQLLTESEFPAMPVVSRAEIGPQAESAETIAEIDAAAAKRTQRDPESPRRARRPAEIPAVPTDSEIAIIVRVSAEIPDDAALANTFSTMQEGLFYELGIMTPEVRIEHDPGLGATEFRITINDEHLPPVAGLARDEYVVNDSVQRLSRLGVKARPIINPGNGSEAAVVRESEISLEQARDAGLMIWQQMDYIMLVLSAAVRRRAASFQTLAVTRYILDVLSRMLPDLIRSARARFPDEQVCGVLRLLLEEEISIRDLPGILEGILAVDGTIDVDLARFTVLVPHTDSLFPAGRERTLADLTVADYADAARTNLKRYILSKYGRAGNSLDAFILHPDLENSLRRAEPNAEQVERIKALLREQIAALPTNTPSPVVLTAMDVRRPLRKLLADEFPQTPVLSYQELPLDANIQTVARSASD
jgi:type III secretory pathway component EscV/tetratricopeptide (TPR) repeat protein